MSAVRLPAPTIVPAPARLQWVPCNLCGATDAAPLYPGTIDVAAEPLDPTEVFACTSSLYGRYGPVVRCRHCGLTYLNPRLSAELVESAYEEVADTLYAREREGRVHTFSRALTELEQVQRVTGQAPIARGRLLDVGCHIGVFLELALARGWVAEGVEPSQWACAYARDRGLRVSCGTLRGQQLPSESFDAVTLWDVIEHFPDPAAELREVHRLLQPDGLVGITTMNVDSLVARLLGPRWPWLMQMHLYYFSVRTLSALLARCGFRVVSVTPHRRIVSVSYLFSRAAAWVPGVSHLLQQGAERLGLAERLVPIDLGDIFTIYARRSTEY
jgi:2-polyprenyl-3-methyl-5-hydroxy-6-metoxy-1,4-benzoquinol methylase